MSAYATVGKIYLGPITAVTGTSGTLITEFENRTFEMSVPRAARAFRVGLAIDNIISRFRGVRLPVLKLRARDLGTTSIQVLMTALSSAGASVGPNVTKGEAAAPSLALIIRPVKTTEKYLYIPAAQISPTTPDVSIFYSPERAVFADAEIHLMPSRPASQTTPAFLWASSATIASTYSITE